MKRILPFLLAAPIAVYAFACSSSGSGSGTTTNNPDGGISTTNPDGSVVDPSGDGGNVTAESSINPTTGVTVVSFSDTQAAVHGLTWVPSDKVFYAALPTSSDPFDGTTATTVGKVVRINADGTGNGILAGTNTTGSIFSAAFNPKTNKVMVIGTKEIVTLAPTGTTPQTGTVFSSTYAGNLGNEDAGTAATPFAGLNDIVLKKDGTAYVTEPYYPAGAPATAFHRVYYVKADGSAQAVAHYENNEGPNGIALSPDEKTLYVVLTTPTVADPGRNLPVYGEYPAIWRYTVNTDGSLTAGAKFVQVGTTKTAPTQLTKPDGLAVDISGNVYVATLLGVIVYKPNGDVWGTIPVPEQPASLAWGGADLKTLYIGSSNDPCKLAEDPACNVKNLGSIYKATMQVTGIAR